MERRHYCVDYIRDVLEEDALNQKYCTEVLKKLIVKADADIEELEEELLLLETQLQWAEQQKFPDIFELCSKALGEKITSLELSICTMKTNGNNDDDFSLQSKVVTKPLEKVYEIIKALISNSFQDKVELQGDGTEEAEESNTVPSGNSHTLDSSSEPAVIIRDLPETLRYQESVVDTTIADSVGSLLILEEQKLRDLTESNHVEGALKADEVEVQKSNVSDTDDVLTLNSFLELQSQRKKDIMRVDDITKQKVDIACPAITSKPSSTLGRKKSSLKPTGQKAKAKSTNHAQMKVKRKRAHELIFQSKNNNGQEPHPADTGATSLHSFRAVGMENVVIDLDPIDAPSEKELQKPKRKHPTKVDNPKKRNTTSTSNKKKKKVPAAGTFNKISLDSIFKSFDDERFMFSHDAVEQNEPTTTYCGIQYAPKTSDFDLSRSLVGPNDYSALSMLELRSLAKARGLKGFSKMKKDQLITLLTVEVD